MPPLMRVAPYVKTTRTTAFRKLGDIEKEPEEVQEQHGRQAAKEHVFILVTGDNVPV